MATQTGLFTQGPSVEDILAKRNKRSGDLQAQLMTQAAQGARDPAKARAISFLGSSLGRALGGSMGDGNGREDLEAKEAERQAQRASFMGAVQSNDSAAQFEMSKGLQETYPAAALQMLQIGQASEVREKQQAKDTADSAALQSRAATIGDDLSEFNPELAFRLKSNNATAEEYSEGLTQVSAMNKKANGGDGSKEGWSFASGGAYVDKNGNRYVLTESRNKFTGGTTNTYTPIGDAPAYDDQNLQPTDSSGMTVEMRIKENQAIFEGEQQSKKFYAHQADAARSIGKTTTNLKDARRMGELLKQVDTGGIKVTAAKGFTDFFGATPTSVSELDTISKTMMLSSLKTLLGGQLSDGERKAALEVQVALDKGTGANRAIVERYIEIFESRLEREQFLLGSNSDGSSYHKFALDQSIELTAQPANGTTVTPAAKPQTIQWTK